ncbi:MAG: hypothetical protein Kow0069_12980 [Promethearchaeota archaeon]
MLDREYYRNVHGFDPVTSRIYPSKNPRVFWYEQEFSLSADPPLDRAGVLICARVEVDGDSITNRIVFKKRGTRVESVVNCVHTAVCALDVKAASELRGDEKSRKRIVEMARSTELQPVDLSPEEHFASLKSYVAGIAELGISKMLAASYHSDIDPFTLPFGFNSAMQKQMVSALRKIAPEATRALVRQHVFYLAMHASRQWFDVRLSLLDNLYDLPNVLFSDPDTFLALDRLIRSTKLRVLAAKHPQVHPRIMAHLAKEGNEEVRQLVALNWAVNPEVLDMLASDPNPSIRKHVVNSPRVRLEVLTFLFDDPDPEVRDLVRHKLAENSGTSPELLALLAKDSNPSIRRRVAGNGRTPARLLEELALDLEVSVRKSLASNKNLPESVLERLVRDPHPDVRAIMASRDLPGDLLAVLTEDPNSNVLEHLAENPSCTPDILATLARRGDRWVRQKLVQNPGLTADTLAELVGDAHLEVLVEVARHPAADLRILAQLAASHHVEVRREVSRNPKADATVLRLLTNDPDVEVRRGVACHPRTSPELLRSFVNDPDDQVRKNAVKHAAATPELLLSFWNDPDAAIQVWIKARLGDADRVGALGTREPRGGTHFLQFPGKRGRHGVGAHESFGSGRWRSYNGHSLRKEEAEFLATVEYFYGSEIKRRERLPWNAPSYVAKGRHVVAVSLNNAGLDHLPPEIGDLSKLRKLTCRWNRFSEVCPELGKLGRLEELDLAENSLTEVPNVFGDLRQLLVLDLSHNAIRRVTTGLSRLTSLTTLDLSYNQIEEVEFPLRPRVEPSLRRLFLDNNQLRQWPSGIGRYAYLRVLFLNCNSLTTVSPEVGELHQLEFLNLQNNHITSFPRNLGGLVSLQTLLAGGNRLTRLPASFEYLESLQYVDLSRNSFVNFPEALKRLASVKELHFEGNHNALLVGADHLTAFFRRRGSALYLREF